MHPLLSLQADPPSNRRLVSTPTLRFGLTPPTRISCSMHTPPGPTHNGHPAHHTRRMGRRGAGGLLYLDVVKGRFVGDIVEQEQGCGERDGALVLVPWLPDRSSAKQSPWLRVCSVPFPEAAHAPLRVTPGDTALKHHWGPCCKI